MRPPHPPSCRAGNQRFDKVRGLREKQRRPRNLHTRSHRTARVSHTGQYQSAHAIPPPGTHRTHAHRPLRNPPLLGKRAVPHLRRPTNLHYQHQRPQLLLRRSSLPHLRLPRVVARHTQRSLRAHRNYLCRRRIPRTSRLLIPNNFLSTDYRQQTTDNRQQTTIRMGPLTVVR